MLPRELRLPRMVRLQRPHRAGDALFTFYFQKSQLALSRFRIVTSKKLSKKAVERNQMRRLYYQLIQEHIGFLPLGFDIVAIPKHFYHELSEADKESILDVLKRITL